MGQTTLIDIIGSFIVGGILFIMALRMNAGAVETSSVYHTELNLQQNLTTLVEIIEYDFRKIGYCADYEKIPEPTRANLLADSTEFKFLTDVDNDGELDSIHYYVGPPSELTETTNPRDRYIYRVVNDQTPTGWDLGVAQFRFKYYDPLGQLLTFPISDPRAVHAMEISITLESTDPMDQEYVNDPSAYQVFWRQIRLASRNLRNR